MEMDMNENRIKEFFISHKEEYLEDLATLVAIDSSKGDAEEGMPYGLGAAEVLTTTLQIAERYGLYTENWENYLGIIQLNDSAEHTLDIFAHLDVVPGGEGWTITEPFQMKIIDNCVYGRGTADDKGPALAAIYALRAIHEAGIELEHNVRIMVGCDEECGSSELNYYFSRTEPAEMTFSPDGDFPVVNVEKGLFYGLYECEYIPAENGASLISLEAGVKGNVIPGEARAVVMNISLEKMKEAAKRETEVTGIEFTLSDEGERVAVLAKGISGHASVPEHANNAATGLLQFLAGLPLTDEGFKSLCELQKMFPHGDYRGRAVDIYTQDPYSGEISVSLNLIHCKDGKLVACFDSRIPVSVNEKTFLKVRKLAENAGFQFQEKTRVAHYTPEDSTFIRTLLDVYEAFSGKKGECISTGGTTYVHGIKNAVGFGCANKGIDNHMHGPDEFAEIDTLLMSGMMFTAAILRLCG